MKCFYPKYGNYYEHDHHVRKFETPQYTVNDKVW